VSAFSPCLLEALGFIPKTSIKYMMLHVILMCLVRLNKISFKFVIKKNDE
jgi:hypothetical protein